MQWSNKLPSVSSRERTSEGLCGAFWFLQIPVKALRGTYPRTMHTWQEEKRRRDRDCIYKTRLNHIQKKRAEGEGTEHHSQSTWENKEPNLNSLRSSTCHHCSTAPLYYYCMVMVPQSVFLSTFSLCDDIPWRFYVYAQQVAVSLPFHPNQPCSSELLEPHFMCFHLNCGSPTSSCAHVWTLTCGWAHVNFGYTHWNNYEIRIDRSEKKGIVEMMILTLIFGLW